MNKTITTIRQTIIMMEIENNILKSVKVLFWTGEFRFFSS